MRRDAFEVIVVDDGSSDDTPSMLANRSTPFRLSFIAAPWGGPSRARNLGVAAARGAVLAFTEDDVIVADDWLVRACRHLADGADVVDGRTVYEGTERPVRHFENEVSRAPAFIPCNLVMRKAVFDEVGGYDPDFFDTRRGIYFREDTDLGFRILDAGFRVVVAPDVVVRHPVQFTSVTSAIRHARRYELDPLLYRKHPRRFREMLEVKCVVGLRVHRPLHYVALLYLITLSMSPCVALVQSSRGAALTLASAVGCATVFRIRYQGYRAFTLWHLGETLGFMAVPLVYVGSLLRGSLRFRSFGALR